MHDPHLLPLYVFGTVLIGAFGLAVTISLIVQKQRQVKSRLARQKIEFDYSQSLLNTRIEVQETTLNMVARELHDNIVQSLTASFMQVSTAGAVFGEHAGRELIEEAKDNIKTIIRDVRLLSHSLATGMVEQRELHEAIQAELTRIQTFSNITCSLRSETIIEPSSEQRLLLFRIAQEALQNIIKHALATEIAIRLASTDQHYIMTITDNGKGFDMANMKDKASLGLTNMQERAAMLNGTLTIASALNEGTTITIRVCHNDPSNGKD